MHRERYDEDSGLAIAAPDRPRIVYSPLPRRRHDPATRLNQVAIIVRPKRAPPLEAASPSTDERPIEGVFKRATGGMQTPCWGEE